MQSLCLLTPNFTAHLDYWPINGLSQYHKQESLQKNNLKFKMNFRIVLIMYHLKMFNIKVTYGMSSQEDLTSVIILQLLQGPIWLNNWRIRTSVTSLERLPTYLRKKTQNIISNVSLATPVMLFYFVIFYFKSLSLIIFSS